MLRVPPPADTPSPRLPDYELLRLIGRGSYGDVWLARAVTGVFRAVKIIWRERFSDERPYVREFEGVTRFAAISLREPSQLALLHAGRSDDEGFFYYVMELADDAEHGRVIEPESYVPLTLREVRLRRTMLPPAEVVALGVALSRGLATLHRAGLVHRDIKPSNVVLVGGVPKLADIGLVAAASAGLTFVGTEGFVPPEGPGAPSADVYSLGKVLYELATGLDRHDWPRLPPDLASLPDRRALLELNEVLVRACESDSRKRFPDAGGLLDDLLLLQAGKSVRRLRAAERRTARALRMAALLALIATIAGSGAWIEHRRAAMEAEKRQRAEAERDALNRHTLYAAQLTQIQRAIEQDDFGRARRMLAEAVPGAEEKDLRGFEWHAFSHLAQGDPCDVVRESGPSIDFVSSSPDGTLIAVHDEDRKAVIYDTSSLNERLVIPSIQRLAGFSGDGHWMVGSDLRNALQRWRVEDGKPDVNPRAGENYRPLSTQGPNRVVAWQNPVSNEITPGRTAQPGALIVWDFAVQREVLRLPIDSGDIASPWEYFRSASSPSGEEIVVVFGQGRGAALKFRLTYAHLGTNSEVCHQLLDKFLPTAVGFLPAENGGGQWWATEVTSGRQMVFGYENRRWAPATESLPAGVALQARATTSQGQFLLQAQHAKATIQTWGATTRPKRVARGHASLITAIAPMNSGHFFTASSAGEFRRWPIDSSFRGEPVRQGWNPRGAASLTVFSPDGTILYAPENGNDLTGLDVETLEKRYVVPGMRRLIGRTDSRLWGVTADGAALVCWDMTSRRTIDEVGRSASAIVNAVVSEDGKRLTFTRASGELCTVELDGRGKPHVVIGRHEYLWSLTFDPTATRLWTIGTHRKLECRAIPDGRILWSVQMPSVTASLCYNRRTSALVVALENGDLQVHNAENGTMLRRIPSGSSAIQSIVATADGNRLIGGGVEGDLHVFDPVSVTYLVSIPVRNVGAIHNVSIADDARSAAVFGKTGLLHIVQTP